MSDKNYLIDIGACVGSFTESWLESHPHGAAVCVEPNPDNVKVLKEKFKNRDEVRVVEAAIGFWEDSHGNSAEFYFGTSEENGSLSAYNEAQIALARDDAVLSSTTVDIVPAIDMFDRFNLSPEKTVVKIDVEGLEHRVLCSLFDNNIFPKEIFMEDGCRKIRDPNEWKARLKFHETVRKQELIDSIWVETTDNPFFKSIAAGSYIERYKPLRDHYAFKILEDPRVFSKRLNEAVNRKLTKARNDSEFAKVLTSSHHELGYSIIVLKMQGVWIGQVDVIGFKSSTSTTGLDTIDFGANFKSKIELDTALVDSVAADIKEIILVVDGRHGSNRVTPCFTLHDTPWSIPRLLDSFVSLQNESIDFISSQGNVSLLNDWLSEPGKEPLKRSQNPINAFVLDKDMFTKVD